MFTIWSECVDDAKSNYGAERKFELECETLHEARKWREATKLRLGRSYTAYIENDRGEVIQ